MTRARARVVRRSNGNNIMCKYDDANVLFYACWFARRQMPWSSLQGFVRTAGCTLRRLCLPEVGLLHLHLYNTLTDDACADAL